MQSARSVMHFNGKIQPIKLGGQYDCTVAAYKSLIVTFDFFFKFLALLHVCVECTRDQQNCGLILGMCHPSPFRAQPTPTAVPQKNLCNRLPFPDPI